jgi:CRP-like cAMP-binding protein
LLRAHPFFKGLGEAIVNELAPRAVMRQLDKGAVLFRKGDAGSALYAVVSGGIRIGVPSAEGSEAVFNLMLPGDIFGEMAVLDGAARSADAVAAETSTIMVLDRRDFVPLVRGNPDLALRLIEILCSRLRQTSEQVEDIVFLDFPKRLAKALLLLRERSPAGNASRGIHITQRELSNMIGASREATNKQLRSWQKRGLLHVARGKIDVMKPEALADFAGVL